jgi:septum formation protein
VRIILASGSPRRAELLRAAGFDFETIVTDVDESIRAGESPQAYVRRLAAEKSLAALAALKGCATNVSTHTTMSTHTTTVAQAFRPAESYRPAAASRPAEDPGAEQLAPIIVLGADTTVVIDGKILGKPVDDADAQAMLRVLSGRRHEVMTGVSVRQGASEVGRVEITGVHVAPLTDAEVAWYVTSGEGRDKAGAYAIQGLASRFIPRIEGSYSNVVGLPVACVYELITEISGTRRDR